MPVTNKVVRPDRDHVDFGSSLPKRNSTMDWGG
jgi:hypothetical protein